LILGVTSFIARILRNNDVALFNIEVGQFMRRQQPSLVTFDLVSVPWVDQAIAQIQRRVNARHPERLSHLQLTLSLIVRGHSGLLFLFIFKHFNAVAEAFISHIQFVLDSLRQDTLFFIEMLALLILGTQPLQDKIVKALLLLMLKFIPFLQLATTENSLNNGAVLLAFLLEFLLELIDHLNFVLGPLDLGVGILCARGKLSRHMRLHGLASILVVVVVILVLLSVIGIVHILIVGIVVGRDILVILSHLLVVVAACVVDHATVVDVGSLTSHT